MTLFLILLAFGLGVVATLLVGNAANKRLTHPGIDADWYALNDQLKNELKRVEVQNRQLLIANKAMQGDLEDANLKQVVMQNQLDRQTTDIVHLNAELLIEKGKNIHAVA